MNSFDKKAAIPPMQAMLPWDFPIIPDLLQTVYPQMSVAQLKKGHKRTRHRKKIRNTTDIMT